MSDRVFIDTNVFVYAHILSDRNKHKTAINLLKNVLTGSRVWISTQILSEFYSAMNKNGYTHDEIVAFIKAIMQNVNMLSVTPEIVETALHIKGKYHFSYWDSLMLAAALLCECDIVYTEDLQHNQVVEGRLSIRNPFIGQ